MKTLLPLILILCCLVGCVIMGFRNESKQKVYLFGHATVFYDDINWHITKLIEAETLNQAQVMFRYYVQNEIKRHNGVLSQQGAYMVDTVGILNIDNYKTTH